MEMGPEHLAGVLDLIAEAELCLHPDLGWLRYRTLEDPTCLPGLLLVAQEEQTTTGFCLACVRGERGVIKAFAVSARWRRQGIGTALLDEIESRLRAHKVGQIVVEGVAPNYLLPGVDLHHTDAMAFLMQRGYETDRVARVDMAVDLPRADLETTEDEARLAREGIVLRRAQGSEIGIAAEFTLTGFSATWQREVADAARFDVPPLFVALDGSRVIAFAAYDVTGWGRFGPTGTDPAYRRRGIGGALLRMCLRAMRDRGDRKAEIGWAGPLGFYARAVDARISRAYWVFRKGVEG
jgi:ribosomal protein S18 acetylase RimI-like enzyme